MLCPGKENFKFVPKKIKKNEVDPSSLTPCNLIIIFTIILTGILLAEKKPAVLQVFFYCCKPLSGENGTNKVA